MGVQSPSSPVSKVVDATIASQPTGIPAESALGASKQSDSSQYYAPTSIAAMASQSTGGLNQQPLLGLSTTVPAASAGVAADTVLGILGLFMRRRTQRLCAP